MIVRRNETAATIVFVHNTNLHSKRWFRKPSGLGIEDERRKKK
jgi:hypothetical protein